VRIHLKISPQSRSAAELSLDGRAVGVLEPHEYLSVSMSRYPVPCIVPNAKITSNKLPRALLGAEEVEDGGTRRADTDDILDGGWVQDINGMLNFNKAFVTKGMLKHVSED
jgi:NADH kinase